MYKMLWDLVVSLERLDWIVNSKFNVRQIEFTSQFLLVFRNENGDELPVRSFYPTDDDISTVTLNFDTMSAFITFKEGK